MHAINGSVCVYVCAHGYNVSTSLIAPCFVACLFTFPIVNLHICNNRAWLLGCTGTSSNFMGAIFGVLGANGPQIRSKRGGCTRTNLMHALIHTRTFHANLTF